MTESQTTTFKDALKAARAAYEKGRRRLEQIEHETWTLQDDMAKLKRTITALAAMCTEDPGLDEMGITEACLEVMAVARGALTTAQVVEKLEALGFDTSAQKNGPASVHAVLGRLSVRQKDKIKKVTDSEDKLIRWTGPQFDPTYDDIPF